MFSRLLLAYKRRRNLAGVFFVIGVILASCAPTPTATNSPIPTRSPATLPTSTARLAGPTETARATRAPTPTTTLPPPILASTPAPPVEHPLPLPPATGSKLGVHGIWSGRILAFTQTLAEAGAPFRVVKAVDDLGWLKEVKRISPQTVTVGRLTHDHEGAPLVNDPAAGPTAPPQPSATPEKKSGGGGLCGSIALPVGGLVVWWARAGRQRKNEGPRKIGEPMG